MGGDDRGEAGDAEPQELSTRSRMDGQIHSVSMLPRMALAGREGGSREAS